jgi:glycosyltransferase involved in cell wall biosynthesis
VISACVCCRDDENLIARWIACVNDHVEEIVICDTGSKDHSKALVLDHDSRKIRFLERPWPGFIESRNWFFDLVSQPYLLMLEIDEVLLDSFWEKVPRYVDLLSSDHHSIRMPHYNAKFLLQDMDTLRRKAVKFDENFHAFSYPKDVLCRSDLKRNGIQWASIPQAGKSDIFHNLSTTQFAYDAEPVIQGFPRKHKNWNDEYQARKMLTYAKLSPGFWLPAWTQFLDARFSKEKIAEMKHEVFSADDPAPHAAWWAATGRLSNQYNPPFSD